MRPPDFYLVSTENSDMEEPRRCWRVKRLATADRDDLLLVKIDPPLSGKNYGMSEGELELVIVAARLKEGSLFPVRSWPVYVYVARSLIGNPELRDTMTSDEFKLIAWAELYPSEQDARLKVM